MVLVRVKKAGRRTVAGGVATVLAMGGTWMTAEASRSAEPVSRVVERGAGSGTVIVTLKAPRGVPVTAVLGKGRKSIAVAKTSRGPKQRVKVRAPLGTLQVTAPPVVTSGGYYVATVSRPRLAVTKADRSTVTVAWKRAPVAGRLRAKDIAPTSLRLDFARPRGKAKVLARFAPGLRAPRTVKEGRVAPISGSDIAVTGLTSARAYSVSLFTKIGRAWLGPVPLTLSTSPAPSAAGPTATYVAAPDTAILPPSVSVSPRQLTGGQVEISLPAGVTPVLGRPIVLPSSATLPGGFVGTVSALLPNRRTVIRQTALSTAFPYLKAEVPSLGDIATVSPPGRSARARGASTCGSSGSASVSVDPSYDFDGSYFDVEIATADYWRLTVVKGLRLEARIVGNFSAGISGTISGTYTCNETLGTSILTFSLGPVPMMLRYSPVLEVSATGEGTLSGASLGLTAGFEASVYKPILGRVDVDVDPIATTSHTMPTASGSSQTLKMQARVGGTLAFGPGLGGGSGPTASGVQAGISGKLHPFDARIEATRAADSWCVEMSAAGTAQLSMFAAAWLSDFKFEASWPMLQGSLDYAGPWKAPVPCPTDPPKWVGTITTTESYVQTNTVGRAQQTTTYTVRYGDDSTFSSEYSDSFEHQTDPCGTMQHAYQGSGAGDYSTLDFRVVPSPSGGYAGQLFGVDDRHMHDGNGYDDNCVPGPNGYYTQRNTYSGQVVVYPPGHLGCADTVFPVRKGSDRIEGTVTRTCTSEGLRQTSSWTYDLTLTPCDLDVDTDGGGLADCVEPIYGLDPLNPADDA